MNWSKYRGKLTKPNLLRSMDWRSPAFQWNEVRVCLRQFLWILSSMWPACEEISRKTFPKLKHQNLNLFKYSSFQWHGRPRITRFPDGTFDAWYKELQSLRLLLLPEAVLWRVSYQQRWDIKHLSISPTVTINLGLNLNGIKNETLWHINQNYPGYGGSPGHYGLSSPNIAGNTVI